MSFGDEEKGYATSSKNPQVYGRDGDVEYIRLNDRVKNNISQLSNNVTAIQKMVNQLGTEKDTHSMRDNLHRVNESTRSLTKDVSRDLEQLGKIDGGSPQENKQRKLQQTKLMKDFEVVLKKFSDIQRISSEKEREYIALKGRGDSVAHYDQASHVNPDENKHLLLEEQKRSKLIALESEIQYNEEVISEREEGIKDIEGTILEVNEIFRDLGTLVKEQEEMLDNIESNIENVVTTTASANTELQEGSKLQKSARNKKCILLLIGVVVLVILILVIVFVLK